MSTLSSSVGAMLTAASVMISASGVARHVHHEAVADAPRGAQAGLALDHRAPSARRCAGCPSSAPRPCPRAPARTAFAADAWLCGASTIWKLPRCRCRTARRPPRCARAGPTRIGAIRPSCAASTAPAQRALVAGMRDRGRRRRQRLAEVEQPLVFLVRCVPSSSPSLARRGWRATCASRCTALARARRRRPPAPRGCCSSIASCSLDRLRALHALVGEQPVARSVSRRSRSRSIAQQLRQRRERLLGLVAHDDLLLAADAAPLVGRHVRQQLAVVGDQFLLQLQPRQRQRLALARQQERDARERLGIAAFVDRRQRFLDERQLARVGDRPPRALAPRACRPGRARTVAVGLEERRFARPRRAARGSSRARR